MKFYQCKCAKYEQLMTFGYEQRLKPLDIIWDLFARRLSPFIGYFPHYISYFMPILTMPNNIRTQIWIMHAVRVIISPCILHQDGLSPHPYKGDYYYMYVCTTLDSGLCSKLEQNLTSPDDVSSMLQGTSL